MAFVFQFLNPVNIVSTVYHTAISYNRQIFTVLGWRSLYSPLDLEVGSEYEYENIDGSTCDTITATCDEEIFNKDEEETREATREEKEKLYWGSVRLIPDEEVVRLVCKHLPNYQPEGCKVFDTDEGAYNRIYIVQCADHKKFVVRVPACGQKDRWNNDDAFAMRSMVLTMRYIKRKTGAPLPDILAYNNTLENDFGYPYLLMEFIEGELAEHSWVADDYTPEVEAKRQKILKSLAQTMAKLKSLSFPAAGSLYFEHDDDDEPTVGPQYVVDEGKGWEHTTFFKEPIVDTKASYSQKFNDWWDQHGYPGESDFEGRKKILEMIIDAIRFENEELLLRNGVAGDAGAQPFVLAPPDLDYQNIIVDKDCNVIGLLDWDDICTVARPMGWAQVPRWLHREWTSMYDWSGQEGDTPMELERYRQDYTRYLRQAAPSCGDVQYTSRSHLLINLVMALDEYSYTAEYVANIISTVLPHVEPERYIQRIGAGIWNHDKEEQVLRGFIQNLFTFAGEDTGVTEEENYKDGGGREDFARECNASNLDSM